MAQNVYAHLLILFTLLIQGITAAFLKDVEEPSNLLVRNKRVINRIPEEDLPIEIGAAPYAVNIKCSNRMHCVGSILSHLTVITAARCVVLEESKYTVLSGAIYSYLGDIHNVTSKKTYVSQPSRMLGGGIALVTVHPPFVYGYGTKEINLHVAPILPGMHGTITGWGSYVSMRRKETVYPRRLRSIHVPIINHRECVNSYKNITSITDIEICTFHELKQCGLTDAGAPLTIENLLVGVYFGGFGTLGRLCDSKPDVFAFVQHPEYSSWILRNIER